MDNLLFTLKEKLRDPKNLALACIALGLVLGLLIGYVLLPVKWTDASAANLRPDLRVEWLRNAITTYTLTNDSVRAKAAYSELGNTANATLSDLVKNPAYLNSEQINRFTTAVGSASPANTDNGAAGSQVTITPTEETEGGSNTKLLGFLFLFLLVAGGAAAYYFFFRNKVGGQRAPLDDVAARPMPATNVSSPAPQTAAVPHTSATPMRSGSAYANPPLSSAARPAVPQAKPAPETRPEPVPAKDYGKPIAQFMTTYMYGDDLYDELYSFASPNGEFLGECGASISSSQGNSEPRKVNALEVWLFDKNDVQTITKVMMAGDAFEDTNLRSMLERKGEPVDVQLGRHYDLDTATLHLEAKVVDLAYGALTSQAKGYFQRFTLELAIYKKS